MIEYCNPTDEMMKIMFYSLCLWIIGMFYVHRRFNRLRDMLKEKLK